MLLKPGIVRSTELSGPRNVSEIVMMSYLSQSDVLIDLNFDSARPLDIHMTN